MQKKKVSDREKENRKTRGVKNDIRERKETVMRKRKKERTLREMGNEKLNLNSHEKIHGLLEGETD